MCGEIWPLCNLFRSHRGRVGERSAMALVRWALALLSKYYVNAQKNAASLTLITALISTSREILVDPCKSPFLANLFVLVEDSL